MELTAYDEVLACNLEEGDLIMVSGIIDAITHIDDADYCLHVSTENGDEPVTFLWDEDVKIYLYE
jgi:hypothetical protein